MLISQLTLAASGGSNCKLYSFTPETITAGIEPFKPILLVLMLIADTYLMLFWLQLAHINQSIYFVTHKLKCQVILS